MAKEFKTAYDQLTLSPAADERIRAALAAAQKQGGKIIELRPGQSPAKKTRRISLTVLITAAVVLALSITAYAIGAHAGFFDTVFGDTGVDSRSAYQALADPDKPGGEIVTVPAYQREPVDQEKAEELVGAQVTDIRKSFTMEGVTFTAESLVADENGIGALTFTMSCPDGFPRMEGYEGQMYNMLQIDESRGWIAASPYLRLAGDDAYINSHIYLDSAASTERSKHLTAYFYCPMELQPGDTLELVMTEYLYNGKEHAYTDPYTGEERTEQDVDTTEEYISFRVEDLVPAVLFTAQDGHTASVSPMGVVLDDWYDGLHEMTLTYADGSVYTVRGRDVHNTQFGQLTAPDDFGAPGIEHEEDDDGDGVTDAIWTEYPRDDPAYEGMWRTMYVFNRLVEPETVVSVYTSGGTGYDGERQPERIFTR